MGFCKTVQVSAVILLSRREAQLGLMKLTNVGALIIRIGFWVQYIIMILRNPHHSIGSY